MCRLEKCHAARDRDHPVIRNSLFANSEYEPAQTTGFGAHSQVRYGSQGQNKSGLLVLSQ